MLLFFAGVPTAAMRSVADFMLAGRVTDLQALEPWYLSLFAHNFRIRIALQPTLLQPQVYSTQSLNLRRPQSGRFAASLKDQVLRAPSWIVVLAQSPGIFLAIATSCSLGVHSSPHAGHAAPPSQD
jgi:hypothetical protein